MNFNSNIAQETDLLQIPKYLLLRNFMQQDLRYILDLGVGLSYHRLTLGLPALKLYLNFVQPSSPKEISQRLNIPIEEILSICSYLLENKVLYKYQQTPQEFERYNRNLLYYSMNSLDPNLAQNNLSKKTVTLIGMGGIGNWVSLNLIGLGFRKLKLIDADVIETSNLCRQVLFSEKHIGKKKVQIAKEILQEKNSSTLIETVDVAVNEDNIVKLIQESDFVVLSADSPPFFIQKWVNQACVKANIPFFNVGYANGIGIVGPLVVSSRTACLACDNFFEKNSQPSKDFSSIFDLNSLISHYQAPSFTCLNSLVSSIASYEIVKYFLNIGQCETMGYRILLDPLEMKIEKKKYDLNENCKVCQKI